MLTFDRDANPIDFVTWVRLAGQLSYIFVARATVASERRPEKVYDVSTVWLGLDKRGTSGMSGCPAPIIFETMISTTDSEDIEVFRYATEQQARDGHTAIVDALEAELADPVVTDDLAATPSE